MIVPENSSTSVGFPLMRSCAIDGMPSGSSEAMSAAICARSASVTSTPSARATASASRMATTKQRFCSLPGSLAVP